MASRNQLIVVAAALAIVAVGAWVLTSGIPRDGANAAGDAGASVAANGDATASLRRNRGAPAGNDAQPAFGKHAIPLTFENARNLLQLVNETDDRHDAAALGARAQAFDECSILVAARNIFGNFETNDPSLTESYGDKLPIVSRYVKTYLGRCVDLAQARGARRAEVLTAIHAAADAGHPWAKARLFAGDWRNLPVDEFDATVSSILAARDPEAVAATADVMAFPHPDSRYGASSGSGLDTSAWMLVACDLGKRCGADDALMRTLCIFGGICGTSPDFRQFLRDSQPDGIATIEQKEQAILSAIASGP